MSDSFSMVEAKIFETDYFLKRLQESKRTSFEASCFFSAFVSSARSVTFSLQAAMREVAGFSDWYEKARESLKTDQLAKYFVEVRNDVVHKGRNPLNRVPLEHLREHLSKQIHTRDDSHVLAIPNTSQDGRSTLVDAISACKEFFVSLLTLVFECYSIFRAVVDPRWYFTEENFIPMGRTLEDALSELGYPPSWGQFVPSGAGTWKALRSQQPSCPLNPLFDEFLGQVVPDPDEVSS